MKNALVFSLLFVIVSSCSTSEKEPEVTPTPATGTTTTTPTTGGATTSTKPDFSKQKKLTEGTFKGTSRYNTSGKALIYEDDKGVRTLVLESFKVDGGPDLRIMFAKDIMATGAIEITNKVTNGDINYTLSKDFDYKKTPNLIIWCKQFSVLFGSTSLP
ncbi:MAG: DM13 domain-containing protein [Leadbetterella sp.]